ncbi:MAG: glycosyl hydrolase [Chloroflexota bacterium]|nr:glycosyl hydrolase [Chloroflexota bacterium]
MNRILLAGIIIVMVLFAQSCVPPQQDMLESGATQPAVADEADMTATAIASMPTPTPAPTDTPTSEPLVPTLALNTVEPTDLLQRQKTLTAEPTIGPTATLPAEITEVPMDQPPLPTNTPAVDSSQEADTLVPVVEQFAEGPLFSAPEPGSLRSRLGVGVPRHVSDQYLDQGLAQRLGFGWYLDWGPNEAPPEIEGVEFAQMIRVYGPDFVPNRQSIANVLATNRGALWIIGNEPDVPWQDNQTAGGYAQAYHELHTFIKSLDPNAQVAIGGVSQITPLRLQYLDDVLTAYERMFGQPMPVDVWNIHTFILREERDSWGVSIPPGMDVSQGILWEIEDHDNLELFKKQIIEFRRWMAEKGEREKPLIVTEYGILMPEGYGFEDEDVIQFMEGSFDFMLESRDSETGLPGDDNRLVQRLTWFSLGDDQYPTGNLLDPATGELTPVGEAFAGYAARLDAN